MKTAILFSGQLRSFDITYSNIKANLIDSFKECDIFFCVADNNLDLVYKYLIPTKEIHSYDSLPKEDFLISFEPNHHHIPGFLNQWRGVYLVKELMTHYSTEYDYVIRVRPDIMFSHPVAPPELISGVITVSMYGSHSGENGIGVNDKFAIGLFSDMVTYCNFYQSDIIRSYYGNSEQKLYKYLTENGICLNTLDNALIKIDTNGGSRIDSLC